MIDITDGSTKYTVTRGAYEAIYKGMGFYPVGQEPVVQSTGGGNADVTEPEPAADDVTDVDTASEPSDPAEAEDSQESEDEKWCKSIRQKPISQWSKQELKRYATLNNISTDGARTVNDVRAKIAASWA